MKINRILFLFKQYLGQWLFFFLCTALKQNFWYVLLFLWQALNAQVFFMFLKAKFLELQISYFYFSINFSNVASTQSLQITC